MFKSKEIKVSFKDIVKRVKFPEEYDELVKYVKYSFDLNQITEINFFYVDNENDKIIVKNDQEFKGAALYMEKFNMDVIKFYVLDIEESKKHGEIMLQKTQNQDLNQFMKDFVVFCYNNYNQIKLKEKEKPILKDQNNDIPVTSRIRKNDKLGKWVKKAAKIIKGKFKTNEENGKISFQLEDNNNIIIKYSYLKDNKNRFLTKRISIKQTSIDQDWEDEYAIKKIENLLGHLFMNFDTLGKEYDLNNF